MSDSVTKRRPTPGFGLIVLGAGLGYHVSDNLHYAFGADLTTHTDGYSRADLANTGRDYDNIEPIFVITYAAPVGLNADVKLMYDFNARGISRPTISPAKSCTPTIRCEDRRYRLSVLRYTDDTHAGVYLGHSAVPGTYPQVVATKRLV